MIFLYKDGHFDVLKRNMKDRKIAKRFNRDKRNLVAVMIECSTPLHSDVYTIVTAEHFKPSFEPFDITYSIALYDSDMPIYDDGVIKRTLHISHIRDLYNVAALLYQIDSSDDVGDDLCLGTTRIILLDVSIEYKKYRLQWDHKESVIEFINREGLICDTDSFLDASVPRKDMVESGSYITRRDEDSHIQYYYHDRKNYLYLDHGTWKLFDTITMRLSDMEPTNGLDAYGFCMNKTGLLYLAVREMAANIEECESCTVYIVTGHWDKTEDGDKVSWLPVEDGNRTFDAYNVPDVLYMALLLPQIWDLDKFFYKSVPLEISIEFIQHRFYAKSLVFDVARPEEDRCLGIDLFNLMGQVAANPLRKISFDD